MSELDFKVTFDAVDTAAVALGKLGQAMEDRLAALDTDVAPLRRDWTGAASDAYAESKKRWDGEIKEMRALLDRIGKSAGEAGSGYQASERANGELWP